MMLTRCPACSTVFRITSEQLKVRAGKVRCGHCSAVFNALESLEEAPPAAAAAEVATPITPAPVEPPPPQPSPESSPPTNAASDEHVVSALAPQDSGSESGSPTSRWRLLAWGLAGLAALGLLVAQAAYVFRAELAMSAPDLRPLLKEMCGLLDCDIPLPRQADLVGIETSDLHIDPRQQNLLVLVATLKNRAPFAQDYPHLELTLTDTQDRPMVRKVFSPAEYLAPGADVRAGFAANGDLAVNLGLDATDVGASGYRLYLFYP